MHVLFEKRWNFFDKYNEIWKKISNIIKREVNSKLAYIKKYLKAEKNQHKWRLSLFLYTSNVDWFSL